MRTINLTNLNYTISVSSNKDQSYQLNIICDGEKLHSEKVATYAIARKKANEILDTNIIMIDEIKPLNKTVNYNGVKTKVAFYKKDFQRTVKEQDNNGRIKHAIGSELFVINNKEYKVYFEVKLNKKHTVTYTFDSVLFSDNEKKIIEFIINKYGI